MNYCCFLNCYFFNLFVFEKDFLTAQITRDVWVGLHDTHKEGDRKWVDDTPVNYT